MRESLSGRCGRWLCAVAVWLAAGPGMAETSPPAPDVAVPAAAVESGGPSGESADIWDDEDPLLAEDALLEEEFDLPQPPSRDPFEGWNRDVFAFNRTVDEWVFDPVNAGYRYVVPERGREALYRASRNLDAPVVLANHMLQFRVKEAAGTVARFVVNSSFGIGGLFDPAGGVLRVPHVDADFGQTLARYGSPSGPYLMLPVFGPSTVRDVFGDVVDIVVDPLAYLLGPFQWWTLALGGSEGLIVRDANIDDLRALEDGSIDFYAALRSAYLQSRAAAARDARGRAAGDDVVMLAPR